jgi:hypothetical protein
MTQAFTGMSYAADAARQDACHPCKGNEVAGDDSASSV